MANRLNRRTLLKGIIGGGAAALLAGCVLDGGAPDSTNQCDEYGRCEPPDSKLGILNIIRRRIEEMLEKSDRVNILKLSESKLSEGIREAIRSLLGFSNREDGGIFIEDLEGLSGEERPSLTELDHNPFSDREGREGQITKLALAVKVDDSGDIRIIATTIINDQEAGWAHVYNNRYEIIVDSLTNVVVSASPVPASGDFTDSEGPSIRLSDKDLTNLQKVGFADEHLSLS